METPSEMYDDGYFNLFVISSELALLSTILFPINFKDIVKTL